MKPFIASFEKLHNVELSNTVGMDELQKFRIDKQSLQELKEEGKVIQTKEKGWRLKGFSYPYSNIYEKEEYHPVLDEMMTAEYCKGERLKKMFSEELVNQLLQELVESDCIKK